MPTTDGNTVPRLEQRRGELKAKLAQVGDLRPGSLVERYRRCGKAGCHCAARGAEGHGPSLSLTRAVGGKTVTTDLTNSFAKATYRQRVTHFTETLDFLSEEDKDWVMGKAILATLGWK